VALSTGVDVSMEVAREEVPEWALGVVYGMWDPAMAEVPERRPNRVVELELDLCRLAGPLLSVYQRLETISLVLAKST